jgi:hypothetical protein
MAIGFVAWQVTRAGWSHGWLGDFRIFREAGHAVLHGHSPYVQPTVQLLTGDDRFVYPEPFALLFAPFSVLGPIASSLAFLALSVGAVVLAVRLLGVTDWRCPGIALLGAGAYGSLVIGSVGPLLLLATAASWRFRDRWHAGIWLALAAAAKVFLWPLLVWLVVTRRLRGLAAAAMTLVAIVGLWALLDLRGLKEYPMTLRVLDEVERWKSYSPGSLVISVGGSAVASHLVALAIALIGAIGIFALRKNDRAAVTAWVAVALLATPILWMHYLVLLVVPIGLVRPRLSPLWGLPILLWIAGGPEASGSIWKITITLAIILSATAIALRSRGSGVPAHVINTSRRPQVASACPGLSQTTPS